MHTLKAPGISVPGAFSIQKVFKLYMTLQRKIFSQFPAYCRIFVRRYIYLMEVCADYTVRIQPLSIFRGKIMEDITESLIESLKVSKAAIHHYLSNRFVSCSKLKQSVAETLFRKIIMEISAHHIFK